MSNDAPAATSPVVAKALAFQKRSAEAFAPQRTRELDDLKCQIPENLWPDDVKKARTASQIGGIAIPGRPMLSVPKLDQPIKLQMNQIRAAHLGVRIHPLNEKANKETAEIQQGLYRSIEVDSHADIPRLWGSDRAIKCGTGWYRVNVVYDDTTDDPEDLTIRLQRILRQGSVFPDPFAQEADFSDGKELLYVSYLGEADYKAQFPDSDLTHYGDDQLAQLATEYPFWIDGTGDNRAYCVAEYFYTEYRTREWVILDNGAFAYADELPEGRSVQAKRRKVKEPIIKLCKLNAVEELESTTWNGKYIPFIPCIGVEVQPFNGDRIWQGIYSTNKDSAHLFNVAVSNAVEKAALEVKSQWIGAVGQFKTNSRQWQLANTRNLAYLEYDPIAVGGHLAPPPSKPDQTSAALATSIALIEIADNNLQAGTATYDPLLGNSDRDDSGKKVLALQDQGLASNSHWLANLADISMPYESKVVLDLLPKVYDRPGRAVYVTGEDGEQTEVILNHPFTIDQQSKRPVMVPNWVEGQPVPQGAKYYNLRDGKYGTVVSIGKRYETRARAGADAFSQMLMNQPELIKIVGDIWMGFQDFPGHELAAKRLKAAIPPEIRDVENEDGQPDAQALQMELQKATQGAQMMKGIIEEQNKAIETDQIKQQAESQRAEMELQGKVQIETVKAKLAITLQQMKDDHALALERLKQAHANADREDTQAHEVAMEAAGAAHEESESVKANAHQANMGRQAHESKTLTGEQSHEQNLEAGEQSHEHGMESQSQAETAAEKQAAMKPKPKAGE